MLKLQTKKQPLHLAVREQMNTGPDSTVKYRVKRTLNRALRDSVPGDGLKHAIKPQGRTLINEMRMILKERCRIRKVDGKFRTTDRFHKVAQGMVEMMEDKEFPMIKEFLDRDEGKVKDNTELTIIPKMYGSSFPMDGK